MNTTKTITLTITGMIAVAIMIAVIQFLLRKLKAKSETDFKLKSSYGIWFSCLFIAACLIIVKTVTYLSEAIDNIYKIAPHNPAIEGAKIASLYIGISVLWFLVWYFISKVFLTIVVGARNELEEMELNNCYFFLIRGLIIIGLVFTLSPVLDVLFRLTMPNVQLPFYH